MFHRHRAWQLAGIPSPEELADKLANRTWVGCQGFFVEGRPEYLFLNDATCGNGAQEYGVIQRRRDSGVRQIESITFSWCSTERALELIHKVLAGRYDDADYARAVTLTLQTPAEHGRCSLCR